MNILIKKAQNSFSHRLNLYHFFTKNLICRRLGLHLIIQFLLYGIITSTYGLIYALFRAITSDALIFYLIFLFLQVGGFWFVDQLQLNTKLKNYLGSLCIVCWGVLAAYALLSVSMISFFTFRSLTIEPEDYRRLWENVLSFMFPALVLAEIIWQLSRRWQSILLITLGVSLFAISGHTYFSQATFAQSHLFTKQQKGYELNNKQINEASGLASSQIYPNIIWTHNDGPTNHLYGIDHSGSCKVDLELENISARDIEDMAIARDETMAKSYIYLADIGDNYSYYHQIKIYRFPEPLLDGIEIPIRGNIEDIQAMHLRYPNGKRDAEALMIDPLDQNMYIISKREAFSHLYLAGTFKANQTWHIMEFLVKLPFRSVVAADISPNGQEVLIKTYKNVYYWKRQHGESISELLSRPPFELPYIPEPQGEAIAWAADQNGYFTLSEFNQGITPRLYFYARTEE